MMPTRRPERPTAATVALLLLLASGVRADDPPAARFLDLTRGGQPAATIVAPDDKSPIWEDAVALITSPAGRWGGAAPKVVRLARDAPLPAGDLILLGTPATSAAV